MTDFKKILSTIDGLAKDDDNIVFLHDSFDLELNEHFVIETGVVGFTDDGIILEADDKTIEFLELNGMLREDGYDDIRRDGADFAYDPTGEVDIKGDADVLNTAEAEAYANKLLKQAVNVSTQDKGEPRSSAEHFANVKFVPGEEHFVTLHTSGRGGPLDSIDIEIQPISEFSSYGDISSLLAIIDSEGFINTGPDLEHAADAIDDLETMDIGELTNFQTQTEGKRYKYKESASEGKPSAFEIMKDIVANKQAQKIEGVMVDMFTASAITQAYDKVSDNNKKKIEGASLDRLVDIAQKIMGRQELEEIKKLANLDENPNPGDFNQAVASPIGSINKNDEERVADDNVTGKNPYVVSEKWSGDTEIKSTGKWADKTIAELKKARSALRDKEDRTEEETSKLRQINFAIRSKKGWKGGVAETDMPPESSLDLTSPISGGNMREDVSLDEAEYQGRKVTLNKPMQGDVKKSKVYVKNEKGNVVKVNFGHGGSSAKGKTMSIKKNNPERRKAFRARHNCKNPGPKWKARYWSCRAW